MIDTGADAPIDAPADVSADASDGGGVMAPIVDPLALHSFQSVKSGIKNDWGCSGGQSGLPTATVFTLTKQQNMTYAVNHHLSTWG